MLTDILGCVFAVIAIMYTFTCVGKFIRKQDVSMPQIFLMAVGIVGIIACFFIF